MNWSELFDALLGAVGDHWAKIVTGVAVFWFGRLLGRRRARADWQQRQFLNRMMVSLNSIHAGAEGKKTLAIRTLLEKNVDEILLNAVACEKVLDAAAKTTEQDPILPIAPEDRWLILNAVLNEIAEKFATGTLAKDMGLGVEGRRYVLTLTNEVAGPVRTRKIRAMLVQKDLLLGGAFDASLALESPSHITRLDTLAKMRARLEREPDLFLELELVIPR